MNVPLTPEFEAFIQQQVDSKRYPSANDVVWEALRLMREQEQEEQAKLEILRADLKKAEGQLDSGRYVEGKDLTLERVRQGAFRRLGDPSKIKRN